MFARCAPRAPPLRLWSLRVRHVRRACATCVVRSPAPPCGCGRCACMRGACSRFPLCHCVRRAHALAPRALALQACWRTLCTLGAYGPPILLGESICLAILSPEECFFFPYIRPFCPVPKPEFAWRKDSLHPSVAILVQCKSSLIVRSQLHDSTLPLQQLSALAAAELASRPQDQRTARPGKSTVNLSGPLPRRFQTGCGNLRLSGASAERNPRLVAEICTVSFSGTSLGCIPGWLRNLLL